MAFQLSTEEDMIGALNLYAGHPCAFDERSRDVGVIFAAHAAVALGWARTEQQLREAIDTRQVIGEAIGILIERRRITSTEAFEMLARDSQDFNIKLRKVAEQVVDTGEEPRRKNE